MRAEPPARPRAAAKLPVVLACEAAPGRVRLELEVPATLAWFAGHFPDNPILPGVAQIGWAIAFARKHFGFPADPLHIERVKFLKPIRPGDRATLELLRDGERPMRVEWTLGRDGLALSCGRLEFASPD